MKPTPKPNFKSARAPQSEIRLIAFGAHPDDIEFGCGGVIAREVAAGAKAHFVICSRGESGTNGTSAQRTSEARRSAALLGATLEFLPLDGDARLEPRPAHARELARIIREHRPGYVLAPTTAPNQHPDHACLGRLVCDAARLARYGGIRELRALPAHDIEHLFAYAITREAEPGGAVPLLVDVSEPSVLAAWKAAMAAHATQESTRPYSELQLARARVFGLRAGVDYAIALFPHDPQVLIGSLSEIGRGARRF